MLKKAFIFLLVVSFLTLTAAISPLRAQDSAWDGKVIKSKNRATLYYVGSDGKRYVYPNEKTFKSWFNDFSIVEEVDDDTLFEIPLGGNVRYRPGVVLIKIQTSPKVFAVGKNGLLRWIKTEAIARALYGDNWNKLIDDVPDSFFTNYTEGEPIETETEYNPDEEIAEVETADENQGRRAVKTARKARTKRCRVVTRVLDKNVPRNERATEALTKVQERLCKPAESSDDDGGDNNETEDKTAPIITEVAAIASSASATITWVTDEAASNKIEYATESLSTASDVENKDSGDRTTSHSLTIDGLTAEVTYYYRIISEDANGNVAVSEEKTFTTLAADENN